MKTSCLSLACLCVLLLLPVGDISAQPRLKAMAALKEAHELQRNARSRADLEKALEKCSEALQQFERVGGNHGKAAVLQQMGTIYLKLGQHAKALEAQQRSFEVLRSLGDTRGQRRLLNLMAQGQALVGQQEKALELYEKALAMPTDSADEAADPTILGSIARAQVKLGRHEKAVEFAQKSVEASKRLGNPRVELNGLRGLGWVYRHIGQYRKALDAYEQALAAGRKLNDPGEEAQCLKDIAATRAAMGDLEAALSVYQQALAVATATGIPRLTAAIEAGIGQIYSQMGRSEEALPHFQKALDISTAAGESPKPLSHVIADVYLDMADLTKAEPFAKASGSDACLGRLCMAKGDLAAASGHYTRLKDYAEKTNHANALFTAYTGLGLISEAAEDFTAAEDYFEKAMNLTEEIRSGLLPSERASFFQVKINGFSRLEPARGLTRVRMLENRAAESIVSSEVTRARVFSESLSLKSAPGYAGVPKGVLIRESELTARLAELKKELNDISAEDDPERREALTTQTRRAQADLDAFVEMLRTEHRAYAAVKYPRPVSIKDAVLAPTEHVVMYDMLGNGVGVKLIIGKRIAQTFFVRWNLAEIERDVARFRQGFDQAKPETFDVELARRLYKKLLAPILGDIPEGTPLVIIPDGVLATVPFEALVVRGEPEWKQAPWGKYPDGLTFVGDLYPVSYYQSITALTLARTERLPTRSEERLFVLADPVFSEDDARLTAGDGPRIAGSERDHVISLMAAIEKTGTGSFRFQRLPETGNLADGLKKLYPHRSEILTGLQANRNHLLTRVGPTLDRYRWLVFATHGVFSDRIPGISEPFLALTMVLPENEGFLTMTDVMGLELSADLVALPACRTGLGNELAGEGVMSMGRAFQYAGAKSVLMSLWSVAEASTVRLVEAFFTHVKDGRDRREALALARREIRAGGYDHPFFWAAFILVGEAE
jgi:CHAT domain-containing protein